jgi:hypothetical protein
MESIVQSGGDHVESLASLEFPAWLEKKNYYFWGITTFNAMIR